MNIEDMSREQLEAIVKRLPVTADGVLITDAHASVYKFWKAHRNLRPKIMHYAAWEAWNKMGSFYSTRQAAEDARGGE